MEPNRLRNRILESTTEVIQSGVLQRKSNVVLEMMMNRRILSSGHVSRFLDISERQASRLTSALLDSEALKSASTRAPLHFAIPVKLVSHWLPSLFPGCME